MCGGVYVCILACVCESAYMHACMCVHVYDGLIFKKTFLLFEKLKKNI